MSPPLWPGAALAPPRSDVKPPPAPRPPSSGARLRVPGQAQDPLGDDVALHLAGAAGDGEAASGEEPPRPLGGVALGRRPPGAQEHEPELLDALLVLDAEQR